MNKNPYALPAQNAAQKAPRNSSGYQYKPLESLAKLLLFSIGFVCLINIGVSAMETVGSFLFPSFLDPNALLSSDTEQFFIFTMVGLGLLNLPLFIFSAVVTPMFFYRANANLRSLGVRGLQNTPGWCAGYWFIPIVNLFKPYQAAAEINSKSRLQGQYKLPSSQVGAWWACWIVGNLLSNMETRLALRGVDLGEAGLFLSWASSLFTCAAGVLCILMLFAFARAQEKLRAAPKPVKQTPVF